MERIVVILGERGYPITIVSGLFSEPASLLPLKSGEQVTLVTNETLAPLYLDKVCGALEQAGVDVDNVILPNGEQHKNLAVLDAVFTALLRKPHGRDTTLVAPGSGVVGNLTGFAAASYRRSVCLIQVPTTLLSQVDSSVGGKAAVNHPLGENMIGTFHQPASVVVDLDRLKTPPPRESMSGLVEAIRYGIILDDAFFGWLEENLDALLRLDGPATVYCIRHCCELKAEAVVADERETGLRALLNLGYTFGHAIEAEMGYGNWLHGKVIVAGMVTAARTSEYLGQPSSAGTQRIMTLLTRTGLPVDGPCETFAQAHLPYILHDKKALAGKIRLALPSVIGKNEVRSSVSHELVLNAIADCQSA